MSFALSMYVWWSMFAAYPHTQGGDGYQFHRYVEAARVSIARYHELPLWNPYECGGLPLWDEPQEIIGGPLTWLSLFIGTTWTMKIWYMAHTAAGYACMWIFARHDLRASRVASFIAAASWAFCGFHMHHESGGHGAFVAFEYLPLGLFLWRRGERDARCAVGLGLVFVLSAFEGGALPLIYLAVLLGFETLTRAWPPRRLIWIGRALGISLLVALTVGGVRLWPLIDQMHSHKRSFELDTDAMKWATLRDMFLVRQHPRGVAGQQYVWTEYGAYVGPIVLALAAAGAILGGLEALPWVAILVASFALMLGHVHRLSPWTVLHAHVYPFKEIRAASRFRVEVLLMICVLAAIAFDELYAKVARWFRQPAWRSAAKTSLVIVGVVGAADIMSMGAMLVLEHAAWGDPAKPDVTPSPRLFYDGKDSAAWIDQPAQNRGRRGCYDPWSFYDGAPLWEGDVPQVRASDDGAVVENSSRTQNTFTFDVDAKRPTRILINSAYDKGWRTDVGATAEQKKELVVDVPAGRATVHLKYWPKTLTMGFILSIVGTLGTIAFFVRDARRRKAIGQPAAAAGGASPAAGATSADTSAAGENDDGNTKSPST